MFWTKDQFQSYIKLILSSNYFNITYEHNVYRFGHSKNSHNLISALFFIPDCHFFCKKGDSLVYVVSTLVTNAFYYWVLVHPQVPHFLVI